MSEQAKAGNIHDSRKRALEHYERLATESQEWSSFVRRAIETYNPPGQAMSTDKVKQARRTARDEIEGAAGDYHYGCTHTGYVVELDCILDRFADAVETAARADERAQCKRELLKFWQEGQTLSDVLNGKIGDTPTDPDYCNNCLQIHSDCECPTDPQEADNAG